ncbi:MAG: ketoacyl-ACP synthase III [Opitutae bacterium]|nr:ketoacyl-ACP synthase III [Opitutae bacterium]MDG1300058.1 ketoacyl-ACP synthase III [Opitutae bacterium]
MPSHSQSVTLTGTGSYAPINIVTNDDMAKIVDTSDEWIRSRSGIGARHFAATDETTSDMACIAGKRAIEAAGIDRNKIDLIIVATMTPDMPFPSTACLVQSKLGLPNVTTFDMQAACSGFVYGLSVANSMLLSGNFKNALVIGAEKMSGILDFEDRTTCVLFGDGAGAAVLSATHTAEKVGILGALGGADGSDPSLLQQPGGGSAMPATNESIASRQHFLKMNGKEIFKSAVRVMGQASTDIIEQMGYSPEDLNLVIPHQANMRIIESLAKRLAIPMEKFHNNLDRYGNTSAASVPIALDEAYRAGRIQSGDLVLLVAFGAGLTWASTLIRWQ